MGLRWSRTATRTAVAGGAVAVLATALVLVPGGPGEQPAQAASLTPFDDCDELASWFSGAALEQVGPYGLGWYGGGDAIAFGREQSVASGADAAVSDTSAAAPAPAPAEEAARGGAGLDAGAVGPGESGTNVQEVGVDEPDLMKTDGSRLLVVREDRLVVLDVTGSDPRELGSLELPPGSAGELLVSGDTALVLGTAWWDVPLAEGDGSSSVEPGAPGVGGDTRMSMPLIAPGSPTAVLTTVDVSDPAEPRLVRTDEVEGSYISAREHEGVVRVVVQSAPVLPFVVPQGPVSEDDATQENRRVVEQAQAQDWLPQRVERDGDGRVTGTVPLLECADVSRPAEPSGIGLLTVLTVDLSAPQPPASIAVAADGDQVYASTDRLYVATTRGGWAWPMPIEGGAASFARPGGDTLRTQVHAFDVTGPDSTSYVASGEVEGWLMGRWAMSEHEGRLRVATTRGDQWAGGGSEPATDAAVTVLEESGDQLVAVGSVGGLGRGEQVRAVRWFGDVATVVTFRQTDPLYTVDLSDPAQPRVIGELKVPGYSAYLHPLGDGLLLGVGQDATEEGRTLGVQVSTFDLSDLAAPVRVSNVVEPGSWTEVEGDSRQFTYLPSLRTALLPVSGDRGSALWGLQVGAAGELAESGRWSPGADGWIVRAIPLDGGRLAVLDDGRAGSTLTVVSAEGLRELGSAVLGRG
ncbi:MAG TPA: beta-propeller domain-containing protein [Jiangellales bacterium]|nr:beta-propeller domain-containing protein [Jiangellales bacterium]